MKIVVLDALSMIDLNWDDIKAMGDTAIYRKTAAEEIISRAKDADIIFTSKCKMTADVLDACPNLKFIGVLATGYDNIDLGAARERGIAVANVPGYSTDSVAQHTFALMLEITNGVGVHNQSVKNGDWSRTKNFSYLVQPVVQLAGKSLGIIGYGNIGKKVAQIAEAFGMKVNIYSRNKDAAIKSDFVTLHCPATPENTGFINKEFISRMKDGAVLINTARGALVNEKDLRAALESGKLSAAAVDVVTGEPAPLDHPLMGTPNLIITPHIAWAAKEAVESIIVISADNLKSFLEGGNLNRIA